MTAQILPRAWGMRNQAWNRDCGVCALCGRDTVRAREILAAGERRLREAIGWAARDEFAFALRLMGWPPLDQTWWEADHIKPLSEGGPDTLDNVRTLCTICHRWETTALAKRGAKANRRRKKMPSRQKYTALRLESMREGI